MENSPVATLAQLLSFNIPTVVMVPMIATSEGLQPCFDFVQFPLIAPFLESLPPLVMPENQSLEAGKVQLQSPSPLFDPTLFSTPQTAFEPSPEDLGQISMLPTPDLSSLWSVSGDAGASAQNMGYSQQPEFVTRSPALEFMLPCEPCLSHEYLYSTQVCPVEEVDATLKAETPLVAEEERPSSIIPIHESEQLLQSAIASSSSATIPPPGLKRPMNAYLLFCREWREALHKHDPFVNTRDLAAKLGRIWKALPVDVRQRYTSRSKQIKEEFYRKHPQLQRQKLDHVTPVSRNHVSTQRSNVSKKRK